VFYAATLSLLIYAVACRGVRKLPGLVAVLVTAYLAARHFRHLSLYAVVWICYVPAYLQGTALARAIGKIAIRRKRFLLCLWSLIAVAGLTWSISIQFWQLRIPTAQGQEKPGVPVYPAGAVAYLAEHGFRGNLMVPFSAGSFVSWKLHPQVKVSLDSRYEAAYPPGSVEESVQFYAAGRRWKSILDKYATDMVLVPRCHDPNGLDNVFETACDKSTSGEPFGWRLIYRDDGFSLFARSQIAARLPAVDRQGRPIPVAFP